MTDWPFFHSGKGPPSVLSFINAHEANVVGFSRGGEGSWRAACCGYRVAECSAHHGLRAAYRAAAHGCAIYDASYREALEVRLTPFFFSVPDHIMY